MRALLCVLPGLGGKWQAKGTFLASVLYLQVWRASTCRAWRMFDTMLNAVLSTRETKRQQASAAGGHKIAPYAPFHLSSSQGGSLASIIVKQLLAGPSPKYTFSQVRFRLPESWRRRMPVGPTRTPTAHGQLPTAAGTHPSAHSHDHVPRTDSAALQPHSLDRPAASRPSPAPGPATPRPAGTQLVPGRGASAAVPTRRRPRRLPTHPPGRQAGERVAGGGRQGRQAGGLWAAAGKSRFVGTSIGGWGGTGL